MIGPMCNSYVDNKRGKQVKEKNDDNVAIII